MAGVRPGHAAWGRVEHDGVERVFRVLVPAGIERTPPTGIVLALHGGLGVARGMALMTGFDATATREGFAVVYPAGLAKTWNAGTCCGAAARDGVDDVGFLSALIERLVRRLRCDPGRVFVTGMSNGGMMAYRMASEQPDVVAAIAPVAAGWVEPAWPEWPRRPVSVLVIHGTHDRNAPYEGGVGPRSLQGTAYPPVREVVERLAAACACQGSPRLERDGIVTREIWSGGAAGTEVELITIEGGGHSWPGGRQLAAVLDPPSPALDATAEIWRFFDAHPRLP